MLLHWGQEHYSYPRGMNWCHCPGDGPGGDFLNETLEQKTTVNIFFFVLLLSNKRFFGFVLFLKYEI